MVSLKRKNGLFAGAVPNLETHPSLDTYICFKKWLHVKDVNVHVFCTWSIFQISGNFVIEDFPTTSTTVVDGSEIRLTTCDVKKNLVNTGGKLPFAQLVNAGFLNHQQYEASLAEKMKFSPMASWLTLWASQTPSAVSRAFPRGRATVAVPTEPPHLG